MELAWFREEGLGFIGRGHRCPRCQCHQCHHGVMDQHHATPAAPLGLYPGTLPQAGDSWSANSGHAGAVATEGLVILQQSIGACFFSVLHHQCMPFEAYWCHAAFEWKKAAHELIRSDPARAQIGAPPPINGSLTT